MNEAGIPPAFLFLKDWQAFAINRKKLYLHPKFTTDMSTIFILFMILIMIACVLLTIIIMAQNPKGGGLSGTFGGTSSAQFGVQRTNDFMEKSTWILAGIICALIVLSIVMTAKPSTVVNTPAAKTAPATPAKQTAPTTTTPAQPAQTPATANP